MRAPGAGFSSSQAICGLVSADQLVSFRNHVGRDSRQAAAKAINVAEIAGAVASVALFAVAVEVIWAELLVATAIETVEAPLRLQTDVEARLTRAAQAGPAQQMGASSQGCSPCRRARVRHRC